MYVRAVVKKFGVASNVVELERHARNKIAEDQIRLRMTTRCINPSDLITISGAYKSRTTLPFLPGFEGIGYIEEIGAAVRGVTVGDRMLPIGGAGTWQEIKDVDPDWCLSIPQTLTDDQACTSYVNPMTAWVMFHEVAKVSAGMNIAITAAGSAIGQMLIRLANALDIVPIAFVRSDRSAAIVSNCSEHMVACRQKHDLYEMLRSDAAKPLDVVFDCVGGPDALALSRFLRPGGYFVHFGLLSQQSIPPEFWTERPDIQFSLFHLRQWIRSIPLERVKQTYMHVSSLVATGLLSSNIRAKYPLSAISQALTDAQFLKSSGKILISN